MWTRPSGQRKYHGGVVNYYKNVAIQGLFIWSASLIPPLCVLLPQQVKLCKQNVEMCGVSKEIRLKLQVRARLHFPTGNESKKSGASVWMNCGIFCQVLHRGTFSSIHHLISLNSAAHRNLFSAELTWGSCHSLEYSNKQLSLTDSGNNVRNVTFCIVCFSLPPR